MSGSTAFAASSDHALQRQRVLGSEARLIVIEVDEDVAQMFATLFDALCPGVKNAFAVVPLIFVSRSVQSDIGEICRNLERRLKSGQLVNTERRIVPAQNVVHLGRVPALVPELEDVTMATWK